MLDPFFIIFRHIIDIAGLYESLPFIRQRSARLERKASANP